eukprot:6188769-Pleurochrysis_carterae.AAC.3
MGLTLRCTCACRAATIMQQALNIAYATTYRTASEYTLSILQFRTCYDTQRVALCLHVLDAAGKRQCSSGRYDTSIRVASTSCAVPRRAAPRRRASVRHGVTALQLQALQPRRGAVHRRRLRC